MQSKDKLGAENKALQADKLDEINGGVNWQNPDGSTEQ